MPKRNKRADKLVRTGHKPGHGKRPRGAEKSIEANKSTFTWRVRDIDYHGAWGWGKVTACLLFKIINRLHDYEGMSWGELLKGSHNHAMDIAKINTKAKARLQKTKFPGHGAWGWGKVTACLLFKIINRLHDYEGMSWGELLKGSHNHAMDIAKINTKAKARLQKTKFPGAGVLHQLNFGKKERIWGVREGAIFHVLWWDQDHTVYKTQRKNT